MTCAICLGPVGAGLFRDALDRPVHYVCKARLEAVRSTAGAIIGQAGGYARAAALTPTRRQLIAREAAMSRWKGHK